MKTIQIPWFALRTNVAADDAALSTFDIDSWPTSKSLLVQPDQDVSGLLDARRIIIAMHGLGVENATAGYRYYGRRGNGPILLLATGVMTLGTQLVTKDPITKASTNARWADTLTITGGLWSDMAPLVMDTGNNRIAMLRGRNDGMKGHYLEIDLDAVGSGDYCTRVDAIISGTEDA